MDSGAEPLIADAPPVDKRPFFERLSHRSDDGWWVAFVASDAKEENVPPSSTETRVVPFADRAADGSDRTWLDTTVVEEGSFGCASHRGPPSIWQDKENEDFAFSVVAGDRSHNQWVLAGVCDGVAQSPWSARAAQAAAECFVDLVSQELLHGDLAVEVLEPSKKLDLAQKFRAMISTRLESIGRKLQAERKIDPKFSESLFIREFLDGPESHRRAAWLQTTILATALGPHGGLLLVIGDGYFRVDRTLVDGTVQVRQFPLNAGSSRCPRRISSELAPEDVLFRGVAPEGAKEIRVVLATDGVADSPDHGLGTLQLEGPAACRAFLDALASRPAAAVAPDNMSIAFAARRLSS